MKIRLFCREEVACIQGRVAKVFPERSVKFVRPRVGDKIDDSSASSAKRGRIVSRLEIKLLYELERRLKGDPCVHDISYLDAV